MMTTAAIEETSERICVGMIMVGVGEYGISDRRTTINTIVLKPAHQRVHHVCTERVCHQIVELENARRSEFQAVIEKKTVLFIVY